MALTLRFQRHGGKHRPFYHLVATNSRSARNGKFIEKLGYYDPAHEPSQVVFKQDRIQHWYSLGATVSSAVANVLRKQKIVLKRAGK